MYAFSVQVVKGVAKTLDRNEKDWILIYQLAAYDEKGRGLLCSPKVL